LPYKPVQGVAPQDCEVCGSPANVRTSGAYIIIDCSRCGDFQIDREAPDYFPLSVRTDEKRALASFLIHKMQGSKRPILTSDFFKSLSQRALPTPTEMSDNLLLTINERVEGRPGRPISLPHADPRLAAAIGAVDGEDVLWAVRNLEAQNLIKGTWGGWFSNGWLTASGWARIEELQRAHVSSSYAFFARKFVNDDLDTLYVRCLRQAVVDTGFELRTVTQKAGHIDAIIEDEIRRCRFLLADLSDEGLGKPVIYICRDKVQTHFDTDHRQTVRWDLNSLAETAARLKAVIRNTLLGDAKQAD
jgi:hypothetical protein